MSWPEFRLPPINLWSLPKQNKDLVDISGLKDVKFILSQQINRGEFLVKEKTFQVELLDKAIKQREFIYYTRTGRFPEWPAEI